jgi:hypothetical protein
MGKAFDYKIVKQAFNGNCQIDPTEGVVLDTDDLAGTY